MFPEVWQRISIGEFPSQPATLRGYAMYRVKDAVYPGIILSETPAEVQGLVYADLDEDTLFELDTYESSFYERLPVMVTTASGEELECHSFIVPQSRRDLLTNEPWDREWFRLNELDRYLNG